MTEGHWSFPTIGVRMSRVLLFVILGVLLLLPAAADAAGPADVVMGQSLRRRRKRGRHISGTITSSSSTPGQPPSTWRAGAVQYATAAGATWQSDRPCGNDRPGPLLPGPAGIERRRRRRTSAADATGTSNLGAASGKIALVSGTAALTCGARPGGCSGLVEDFVGYGDASDFEGSGSAAALSNTTAALRADGGCTDTDDNATDFTAATPAPRTQLPPHALVWRHAFPRAEWLR